MSLSDCVCELRIRFHLKTSLCYYWYDYRTPPPPPSVTLPLYFQVVVVYFKICIYMYPVHGSTNSQQSFIVPFVVYKLR